MVIRSPDPKCPSSRCASTKTVVASLGLPTPLWRMSKSYGQYCPLSLAAELLCQRWTVLVISRVIDGCHRFNDIRRGIPRISPSLLARRLRELEEVGILRGEDHGEGRWREYHLTQAGSELEPVVNHLAVWGQRWGRDMVAEDLDPGFLVWSMHTRLNLDAMPEGRTVIGFRFSGAPEDCTEFWLVNDNGKPEMCLKDPGYPVDVWVKSDLLLFIETWRGFRDLRDEIHSGRIRVSGSRALRRQLPDWLLGSSLAVVPRLRPGHERDLMSRRAMAKPDARDTC